MKIKTKPKSYEEVMRLPRPRRKKPKRPWFLLRLLIRVLAIGALVSTRFSYSISREDRKLLKRTPCLVLMNHSCFLDLKIASKILFPRPYSIVSTSDGMVGKGWLMRRIGCIPTQKFVSDIGLIRDMKYALDKRKQSVLMYPEAGYSLDGRTTVLPPKFGGLLKLLQCPVMMIETKGAFARDPLYNGLQLRRVKVSATVRCLATKAETEQLTAEELDARVAEAFSFDAFAWQAENGVKITESFRADGLERVLYRCDACGAEGQMEGKGEILTCHACGRTHRMDELGRLAATNGETRFAHIPDWYDWQRACVRRELEEGTYRLDTAVKIAMLVDEKALYTVGEGRLVHDENGFVLTGCGGALCYEQKPLSSYTLNADFFWYEMGDVIGIGNRDALYYCFPERGVSVTRARLATEELYRMKNLRGKSHE